MSGNQRNVTGNEKRQFRFFAHSFFRCSSFLINVCFDFFLPFYYTHVVYDEHEKTGVGLIIQHLVDWYLLVQGSRTH